MMKIIQSFWTGDRDALHSSYGWLTPMDHYLSWILSCNQLRKQYDQVCLVTDQQGYEILVEGLSLPYTEVKICLDTLNGYNPNLWALAKIKAKVQSIYFLRKSSQSKSGTVPFWVHQTVHHSCYIIYTHGKLRTPDLK